MSLATLVRLSVVAAIVGCCFILATKAPAAPPSTPDRALTAKQALRLMQQQTWGCQDELGIDRTPAGRLPARPIGPAYARWLLALWRGRSETACGILGDARHNPVVAINVVFKRYRHQARDVAWCESRFDVSAVNPYGYEGLFQMGRHERATWGHGPDALTQSQAAYRYFAATGHTWGPWQCRPGGHLAW